MQMNNPRLAVSEFREAVQGVLASMHQQWLLVECHGASTQTSAFPHHSLIIAGHVAFHCRPASLSLTPVSRDGLRTDYSVLRTDYRLPILRITSNGHL